MCSESWNEPRYVQSNMAGAAKQRSCCSIIDVKGGTVSRARGGSAVATAGLNKMAMGEMFRPHRLRGRTQVPQTAGGQKTSCHGRNKSQSSTTRQQPEESPARGGHSRAAVNASAFAHVDKVGSLGKVSRDLSLTKEPRVDKPVWLLRET